MPNHGCVIANPVVDNYSPDCLRWEPRPRRPPGPGQVRVHTQLLSIDPATRNWLSLDHP